MKTTINKAETKNKKGEYSSIEELVQAKLKRSAQTLKNVDLSKLQKLV